jgi:hypothetical protein
MFRPKFNFYKYSWELSVFDYVSFLKKTFLPVLITIPHLLFLTGPIVSQDKISCPDFSENSKISHLYIQSKEALLGNPYLYPCLRVYFITEPSLESLYSFLQQTEQQITSQESFELHTIALTKAMSAKNVEYGLEWGKKIYSEWKDKENSHKSLYSYAFFLYTSEDYASSKEVLNWLRYKTKKKSLLKKVELLSKQIEIP